MTAAPRVGGGRRDDAESVWRFSLAFYARPGVAAALIALQDQDGLDVNIILFALWLGLAKARALDRGTLAAAEAAAKPVRDGVVGELRTLRRRLRANPDPDIQALRRRVQALEIAAERVVLARLAANLPPENTGEADRGALAAGNLAVVLGDASDRQHAATIRRALAGFIRR